MGKVIDAVIFVLYPLLVLVGMTYLGIRLTAVILLLFVGRRIIALLLANKAETRVVLYQAAAMGVIMGAAALSESPIALRAAPFFISLTFIFTFAISLRTTPLIERFARMTDPELSEEEVQYCRNLTKVWVAVLSCNSMLVFGAAFVEDHVLWSILVGPVSYSVLGSVFVFEYPYRKYRFRKFNDKNPADRLLKKLFKS